MKKLLYLIIASLSLTVLTSCSKKEEITDEVKNNKRNFKFRN